MVTALLETALGALNAPPNCPLCEVKRGIAAPMVLKRRKIDGHAFWSCSRFKRCRCALNDESVAEDIERIKSDPVWYEAAARIGRVEWFTALKEAQRRKRDHNGSA